MELEIVQKRENPLLKRVEVRFRVSHPNASSPKRDELRQELAKALHATKDIVILNFLRSDFGRNASRGYAKVYKAKEDALRIERKHILVRNGLLAAEVKAEKAPAPKPPHVKEAPKPPEKTPVKAEKAEKPEKETKPAPEKKEEKPAPKAEKKVEPKKAEPKKPTKETK